MEGIGVKEMGFLRIPATVCWPSTDGETQTRGLERTELCVFESRLSVLQEASLPLSLIFFIFKIGLL